MPLSSSLFKRAKQLIPGGVNSPVRSFGSVGGEPFFIQSAQGPYLFDVEGKQYIDYVGSWGPMILGHSHPAVVSAVQAAASKGLSYGAPTEGEILLAEKIQALMPSVEQIRMVNSGTEATMSAIRLARGFTHRDKIIKFEGCYHGHSDGLLVKAGSGVLTCHIPSSVGVPVSSIQDTLIAAFNDLQSVEHLLEAHSGAVAAVIIEPIAGNMNCILPSPGFLKGLRELCDTHQTLLIFDEVMTGFRVSSAGAQGLYHIQPDLTCLGKIVGGGMPVGAFGGRKDIMEHLAPVGQVYQAGTLSGNPLGMAAGLATLEQIHSQPDFYVNLASYTHYLASELEKLAKRYHIPLLVQSVCGMFGLFFTHQKQVVNYQQASACDTALFTRFFHGMLKEGIYLAPSAYESGFLSILHDRDLIDRTLIAAEKVFQKEMN